VFFTWRQKKKRSSSVPSLDTHCHIEMKHFFGNATPERSMAFLSSFRVNAKHGKVRKSPWNHWKSRDGQRSFQCFRSLLFMVRKLFLLLCFFILDVHFQPFLPIYRWIRLFYKIGIEQFVLNERQCFDIWYVYELRSFFILF
jgi:hypothetical protein